ncbi:phosphoribosylamine--glycine ligase [Kitasatospora sp. NBC_01287]|uniref:N,N-dimethylformamidase beta subunit family domain-containing protein n=1 Tax=Kitasatospora sp. NBC_01287 TaxID=2903573 RepID=UPI0022527720|nr:N,N-dimethylformamidase beta subunit family domain-containing protein [Kitasatospora sp. NBC_01287]MCX4747595.1 phosphoribosylamine--glycine ligase [Kitasatospora sp. NBC_01287]
MDQESSGRRWESGTLAHGVSDPFGQGPLPWLRSPDQYLAGVEGAVPWYVSTDAPGQQPLPTAAPAAGRPGQGMVGTPRNSDDVVQQIKGFASAGPVYPGGSVDLRVTVHPPRDFLVDVYRIGHYAGAGAQHMTASPLIHGLQQPAPLVVGRTVSCHHWWHSWRQQIPAHWRPGAYVAVLTTADQRHRSHIPFTVRDPRTTGPAGSASAGSGPADTGRADTGRADTGPAGSGPAADLLLVLPDITWQAYNLFPEDGHTGASLYHAWDERGRLLGEPEAAVTVSFDRPHAGAGLPLHVGHAYDFIRWAERYGYDLAYATASDLHAGLVEPSRHRALIFPGHDEYWSEPMRRTVERARDGGTSLVFLSANTMYWRVELTSGASGEPGRLLNCRKRQRVLPESPAAGPAGAASALWRDSGEPEQHLLGVQYAGRVAQPVPLRAGNTWHWLWAGTGLRDGDEVANLVAGEADRYFPKVALPEHRERILLAHSPYRDERDRPRHQETSLYRAPSGAYVFASGTFAWSPALDRPGHTDERIQKATANLLDRVCKDG